MMSKQCPHDSPEATSVSEEDDNAVQSVLESHTPDKLEGSQETEHDSGNNEVSAQVEQPGYGAELPKVQPRRSKRVQFARRVSVIRTPRPHRDVQISSHPSSPLPLGVSRHIG